MGRKHTKDSSSITDGSQDGLGSINTDDSGLIRSRIRMRNNKNVNFNQFYEEVKVIGEGSISRISLIRRRRDKRSQKKWRRNFERQRSNASQSSSSSFFCPSFLCRNVSAIEEESNNNSVKNNNVENEFYALKEIQLRKVNDDNLQELRNEITILKSLDHPNIVKAYETYETKKQIYIVMELCEGGDLWSRSPYTENQAAKMMGQIMSAVTYLHKHDIIHRDLKLENIMFESRDPEANVKIIDFGLSKKYVSSEQNPLTARVGTVYTMSPQVIQGVYTSQADVWSCGVIAYALLSDALPFYGKKRRELIAKILTAKYDFDLQIWKNISPEAKNFVSSLLKMDPTQRLTAERALNHKWLLKTYPLSRRSMDEQVMQQAKEKLVKYHCRPELGRLALYAIAHKATSKEIRKMRQVFDQIDTSNDGMISFDEFQLALKDFGCSEEELKSIFKRIGFNKNGDIDYTQFLAATLEAQVLIEEEDLAGAFDTLDRDDSGYITQKDLRHFMGNNYSDEEIKQILDEADLNKDGKVSFQEFLEMFRDKARCELRKECCPSSISSSSSSGGGNEEGDSER